MLRNAPLRRAIALGVVCAALAGTSAPSLALTTTADGDPGTLPCMVKSQVSKHFRDNFRGTQIVIQDLGGSMFLVNYIAHFRYEAYFNGCTREVEKRTRL